MVATLYVYAAMFLQTTGSSWDLRTMWSQMSFLPRAVVVTLFVLSVYSFGVMIDRALMYSAARKQSRIFVQQVAGALKDGKLALRRYRSRGNEARSFGSRYDRLDGSVRWTVRYGGRHFERV